MPEKKEEVKREDIIMILEEYYKSIGRVRPPPYHTYSLQDLKKCLTLFKLNYKYI